jgi:hypothetical protein
MGDDRVFGAARTTRRRWPCTLAAVVGLPLFLIVAPFVSNAFGTGTAAASPAKTSISLQLGKPGTAANTMNIEASNMRPGDIAERTLDVVLGTKAKARVALSTRIAKTSILDKLPKDGLQIEILSCAVPWTEGPPLHYTCRRGLRTVLASEPLAKAKQAGPIVLAKASGSTTFHLRVVLTLPRSGGNELQGQVSVLRFDLSALPARAR